MEQASHSGTVLQSTLVNLPIEVLLYVVSFLSTRDKVRIRCVSKTLCSVSEVTSLWEEFAWPHYTPRDEKLLKHVLKMFGKHVKRFHLTDRIAPSKLEAMLKFCKNVVHLSLPSFRYVGFHKLEKMVHGMEGLQALDIHVPLYINDDSFIQSMCQLFTLSNLKVLSLRYGIETMRLFAMIQQLLEGWADAKYVPRKLNIIVDRKYDTFHMLTSALRSCVPILRTKSLQKIPDSEHTAWVNIHLETSTTIPYIQLRVTDSSVCLSLVKASKFGILGLDYYDTIRLSEGICHGRRVCKAIVTHADQDYVDTSVTSLTCITHFNASRCGNSLYPGHLEQLSITCPNLQMLNLSSNRNCLNNLEGLHRLANSCKNLRSLNLKEVHVHDRECDCIQLWEILCKMHLTQLAVEHCTMKMSDGNSTNSVATAGGDSIKVKQQKLIQIFQKYSSLKFLEVGVENFFTYSSCHNPTDNELSLITNFPSITSYRLCNLPSNNCHHTLRKIFSYKYLRCLYLSKMIYGILSLSLEGHCTSLQQLYIHSTDTVPTEAFIDGLCAHGRLEHVILCLKSLTSRGIENIIEHSTDLVTFRVYLYSRVFLKSQLHVKELIKTRFSKRKLFSGGNFDLQVNCQSPKVRVNEDTDLLSIWHCDSDI